MLLSLLTYYSYSTSSDSSLELVMGFFAAYIGIVSVISLITTALYLIGMWKTYKKMGEPGILCLVPFYNVYVQAKRCSTKKNFLMYMIGFGIMVFASLLIPTISSALGAIFIVLLYLAGFIFQFVFMIKIQIGLCHSFGASGAFVVGLIFLPYIFYMILGFGHYEYTGNLEDESMNYQSKADYYGGYSTAGYENYSNSNSYNRSNGMNNSNQNNSYSSGLNNYQNNSYSNGMNNNYQNNSYSNGMNNNYQNNSYSNGMNNNYQNNSYSNGMNNNYQSNSYSNGMNNNYSNNMNAGYNRSASVQPKDMADLEVPIVDDSAFEQYERTNGRKPNNDNFMNGI